MAIFSRLVNGILTSIKTITSSTGGADADKIASTNENGYFDPTLLNASQTGGASYPNVIVQTDAAGHIPESFYGDGVGATTFTAIASEAIGSGKNVNEWVDSGVLKVRLADASGGKPSFGFTKAAFASGATVTYYREGSVPTTGATVGPVYLGTLGGFTSTAPEEGSGYILQPLGNAYSSTIIYYKDNPPVLLSTN